MLSVSFFLLFCFFSCFYYTILFAFRVHLISVSLVIPRTGRSKVELCDTLTDKKELIHTKQGASSSLLSHLFNQGLISAELIKSDLQFCEKANEEIKKQFKEQQLTGNISDYLLHSDDKLTIGNL